MTTASTDRGVCRHDGHTISSHIQVPRRDEIGDCPGFDPITTEHPKYCLCDEHGQFTKARIETEHWHAGDARRPMTATEQEISDELGEIFG